MSNIVFIINEVIPMLNKFFTIRNGLFMAFFTSLMKLSSLFKVSFFVGSTAAFFSATSITQPLIGVWGGVSGSSTLFIITMIMRMLIGNWSPFILLAYHIPGFFASLSLASRHWVLHIVLPIMCMMLFVAHPVGLAAFPYAFYWLIPIALYFMKKKSFFFHALGSTFIAHGIGSVVWIWARPMTAQAWYALIPVVCVERLLFASGMSILYFIINYAMNYFENKHYILTSPRIVE